MKVGQMSIQKLSTQANYLQLDICGLSPEEAVKRFEAYQTNIPIVLHGDWSKKGCSENNIQERITDYVEMIRQLKEKTVIFGFTMHPTFRKKVSFEDFYACCREIEIRTGIEVWIENRSHTRIWLSTPEEIVSFSQGHTMTIDVAQLYISCGYSNDVLKETLSNIQWKHVREMHVANVKRTDRNTLVARKIEDGEINLKEMIDYFQEVPYWTLEILGGVPTFESQVKLCRRWME